VGIGLTVSSYFGLRNSNKRRNAINILHAVEFKDKHLYICGRWDNVVSISLGLSGFGFELWWV